MVRQNTRARRWPQTRFIYAPSYRRDSNRYDHSPSKLKFTRQQRGKSFKHDQGRSQVPPHAYADPNQRCEDRNLHTSETLSLTKKDPSALLPTSWLNDGHRSIFLRNNAMPKWYPKTKKHCRWCGNAYTASKPLYRDGFCSPTCKQAHYRAYKKYVTGKR